VILLQVDLVFGNEFEIVCEGFYKIKDASIFARSLIPNVGYYRWLHDQIHQSFPNNKANYLIRTI
jgi:hypothetical protein